MVEISASLVMKLRKRTGQGMMDCKRALQEAEGNMDKAEEVLRKKGLATLSKRAERETPEGLVVGKKSGDGKAAVLATLCCETDFVAKNQDFEAAAEKMEDYALACKDDQGVEHLLETELDGEKFKDVLTELVSKTGEKTEVGDYAKFKLDGSGLIEIYIHFNQKVGTMVQIDTSDEQVASSETMKKAASDIAMHITAAKPLALKREEVDSETIEREKAIFADQMKDKPEHILDKIVQGKMKKFYQENCLLEQAFVKDDSKSISDVINEAAKQAGGTARIKRFVRFEIG